MSKLEVLYLYILVMLILPNRRVRIFQILLALDHFALAIFTAGDCKPYEMISSALWSLELDKKWVGRIGRPIVDFGALLLGSTNHCFKSYTWQKNIYHN